MDRQYDADREKLQRIRVLMVPANARTPQPPAPPPPLLKSARLPSGSQEP